MPENQHTGGVGRSRQDLNSLVDSLPEPEAVRSWLSMGRGPDSPAEPRGLFFGHEPVVDERRPSNDDPRAVRSVGIIGGGTAGYLTALALRAKRPWLDVTLVESSSIPIIGVGEATVPSMVTFLHHYLGIDAAELYERVEPTWKLGIKFEWGPDPAGFMAPFDWDSNSVGLLGTLANTGGINGFTVQSLMMMADRVPVFDVNGKPVSLMKHLPFAYHLDNGRFAKYLAELAEKRGVRHVEATLGCVERGGEEWVDHVRTTDGRRLEFDFYVDCSGFRSMLLGSALNTPFRSYESSLAADRAVTGNVAHHGHLKPYTTATTMEAGWHWTIPTPDDDHLGYVYSSAALSDSEAADELARMYPGITEPRFVRFRSGRHQRAWRGNVMAVGNSYAFVEPLESSGLLMITLSILTLVNALPVSWSDPLDREVVNLGLANRWDAIRWFLAIHYRFNTRRNSPFWKQMREEVDVSGIQPVLDAFTNTAPMKFRDPVTRGLLQVTAPTFYGLAGVDTILLGQKVPARILRSTEPAEKWYARWNAARRLVDSALSQRDALAVLRERSALHAELLEDDDSWAGYMLATRSGMA